MEHEVESFSSDSSGDRSNSDEEDKISSVQKYQISFGNEERSSDSDSNESVIPCARNRVRGNQDDDGNVVAIEKISPDCGM